MIRYLFALLDFTPRFTFPLGFVPAPMVRQGRVSGVRAAKRLSRKHRHDRRAHHA